MDKKLLVIGGHATPALAVIDRIISKYKSDIQIIFVGRKTINRKEVLQSFEFTEVTNRGIKFLHLETGRINRMFSINLFIDFLKVLPGIYSAFRILNSEKPTTILSFGGYLAFPICVAGFCKKIPIYTHEQTIKPGLANSIIALLSRYVFVSFPESTKYFSEKKVIFTGNPIRKSIFLESETKSNDKDNIRSIYITGGSMGSHSINLLVEEILEKLLVKYNVIHQTGNISEYKDFERLLEKKKNLPAKLSSRYSLFKHINDSQIANVYAQADIVVGRSGANTIFELIALEKPAILIPLPWSAGDEQKLQAKLLENAGVAEIFDQSESSEKLLYKIVDMMLNIDKYKSGFNALLYLYNRNATDKIIDNLF